MEIQKKHIKPLAGLVFSIIVGVTIATSIPLTAQFTTCPTGGTPCFDGNINDGTNVPFDLPRNLTITELILRAIYFILNVILIVAVLAIIIAGVYLIVGMGSESSKDRAKNIILYTLIGILIILFSRSIVQFFMGLFT